MSQAGSCPAGNLLAGRQPVEWKGIRGDKALATDGIQRGHMALHARQVAVAAGAIGDEVERVAKEIHGGGHVTLDAAQLALTQLRKLTGASQEAAL